MCPCVRLSVSLLLILGARNLGAGNLGAGNLGARNLEAGNLGAGTLGAGNLGAGNFLTLPVLYGTSPATESCILFKIISLGKNRVL